MTGLVLIVDDVPSNLKVLEAYLHNDFFETLVAEDGNQALGMARSEHPDLILLDIMMPEMDGFEVCRNLKKDPVTAHIPVVMVTALKDQESKIKGLECGADDFITKPVDSVQLLARVRSLIRLKRIADEWRVRQEMIDQFAAMPAETSIDLQSTQAARMLAVDETRELRAAFDRLVERDGHIITYVDTEKEDVQRYFKQDFDLILVNSTVDDQIEKLRLCSTIRATDTMRHTPILLLVEGIHKEIIPRALEVGVNDCILLPPNPDELVARTRTQIKRKRYHEALQENYERSLSLALTDSLTGLYNRRYAESHMNKLLDRTMSKVNRMISVLMIDIDHFKSINDTFGHGVGDYVLREVASRLSANMRNFDLIARLGGEEFLCVMPDTKPEVALKAAERLGAIIAESPFYVPTKNEVITVTVSIGIASGRSDEVTPHGLLERADAALYEAKDAGRNCVKVSEAA